jgi:hypothetical protein
MIGALLVIALLLAVLGTAAYFLGGLFGPRLVVEGADVDWPWNKLAPEEYADQEFPEPEHVYVVTRQHA